MTKIKFYLSLFVLVFILLLLQPTGLMASGQESSLPTGIIPLNKTSAELYDEKLELIWLEGSVIVKGKYYLLNPTNKASKLTLILPNADNILKDSLSVQLGEQILLTWYDTKRKTHLFQVTLLPQQEHELSLQYEVKASTANGEELNQLGFHFSSTANWKRTGSSSLAVTLKEIHPAQITEINSNDYIFAGDSLVWEWDELPPNDLILTADINTEKLSWLSVLTDVQLLIIEDLIKEDNYLEITNQLKTYYHSADKENRALLKVAEAYYLEKAQMANEAKRIWESLYDDKSTIPRIYWSLGHVYAGQTRKILNLYEQVQELRVHPLLQKWLAAQLSDIKTMAPKLTETSAFLDEELNGMLIKTHLHDQDGDIETASLTYRWESGEIQKINFTLQPFKYEHLIAHYIPTVEPLQRLFFEFVVTDHEGNSTSSGEREIFYLTKDIPSETFHLRGANLVLADYSAEEQDKVYKWFKSYLKLAREIGFIPVEARNPYIIFLGNSHDFIEQYNGPLFIRYAPEPFAPNTVKYSLHRYFLSYWYGSGWNSLSDNELNSLGDALLLGKGIKLMYFKYLYSKSPSSFSYLMTCIGQGQPWENALEQSYGMSNNELVLYSLWHAYGSIVIAFFFIVFFAWLGKTGYLVKFIQYFSNNNTN